MKKIIYLILKFGIYSCKERESKIEVIDDENLTQHQVDSILTDFKFEYDHPVFIDSTNLVLLPITTSLLEWKRTTSFDGYSSDDLPRYWNILFYNKISGITNLLTESKLRISNYSANIKQTGNILKKSILYEIGDTDYNKDSKLDNKDPEQLFISKNNGTGLKRLSPVNEDLEFYTIIPNSNQIIVRTRRDVNADLEFNREDELIWYKIDLNTDSKPVEMVDSLKRKKIENVYFEQWLKKK